MWFTAIRQHLIARLVAALFVVLVVSPYSEPFATLDGSGLGNALDVSGSDAKFKTTSDALVAIPVEMIFAPLAVLVRAPRSVPAPLAPRSRRREILRL